jgi:hypothetical protein
MGAVFGAGVDVGVEVGVGDRDVLDRVRGRASAASISGTRKTLGPAPVTETQTPDPVRTTKTPAIA